MKGYVRTPRPTVDRMVKELFAQRPPRADDVILDPGCGPGTFIEGILRWCQGHGGPRPRMVGIDLDPAHVGAASERFAGVSNVEIRRTDFLAERSEEFDFVIGNPPYVGLEGLENGERSRYRARYTTARGRFDLYILFFEQALRDLKPDGRLVFITPEKFMYVETARALRTLLARFQVAKIHLQDEETFGELVTYPAVTTLIKASPSGSTRVLLRDGSEVTIELPGSGSSWLPRIHGVADTKDGVRLSDVCVRISCGVATGADGVFVRANSEVDRSWAKFAYPTLAGRDIAYGFEEVTSRSVMLVPYDREGNLLPESELGRLGDFLSQLPIKERLLKRTCVRRKPWYAFHETPPLPELLRPKLLCKDITQRPFFVIDRDGSIVPRHSVYYVVPENPAALEELAQYLNSEPVSAWLMAHCQRAANGFIRLQSHVLKMVPVPRELQEKVATAPDGRSNQVALVFD